MNTDLTSRVRLLRANGLTYSEIKERLGQNIPKSTLSYMCKGLVVPKEHQDRIKKQVFKNLILAREESAIAARNRRLAMENLLLQKNAKLAKIIQRTEVAKIALAMLFWGEGSKSHKYTVMFGNSNPDMIRLFLKLFRQCYKLDKSKFRVTVQCRVGQDWKNLKFFWSEITDIPFEQFYKTQIDPRTKGKTLKNLDYKGVCRIDYLSKEIACDLQQSIKVISKGQ